jgi:hypothetical protein
MKRRKSQIFFKLLVVSFLTAYLAGSFTNMLFIPRYVPEYCQAAFAPAITFNRQVINPYFHSDNFFRVFDKLTIENDAVNELNFIPKTFDRIFAVCGLPQKTEILIPPYSSIFYNHQYSYLSFCTLRI